MYMKLLEGILLRYLISSKIKMEITGFDMEGFSKAMHREMGARLKAIYAIIFEDGEASSDAEKVEAIKILFEQKL